MIQTTSQLETNEQYHADTSRISNSMLSVLKKCPQEFQGRYITKTVPHPEPSESMALGHAVHCLVLERLEFDNRFAIKPEGIDRRTNVGKAAWAEFLATADGKTVITAEDAEIAFACGAALVRHDQLGPVLSQRGIVEKRIDFVCDEVEMRCKPDLVLPSMKLIVDVKTTSDASPKAFANSIADFGYARQASLYRDAVAMEHGVDCRFLFAVVCTKAPFEVACYELTDEAIFAGGQEASALLGEYKVRCELNDWLPVWSKGVVPIGLPKYYKHEVYEVEGVA